MNVAHVTYARQSPNGARGEGREKLEVSFERGTMTELRRLARTAQCPLAQYIAEAVGTYLVSRRDSLKRVPVELLSTEHTEWDRV